MTQPVDYANSLRAQFKMSPRVFSWVLFIALGIFVILLVNKTEAPHAMIPLSEFASQLADDQIGNVLLSGDDIFGEFVNPHTIRGVNGSVRKFRTKVPPDTGKDWAFVEWVLDNRHGAVVEVGQKNELINILIPLIPWLLVAGIVWFFVLKYFRRIKYPIPVPVYIVPPGQATLPPTRGQA